MGAAMIFNSGTVRWMLSDLIENGGDKMSEQAIAELRQAAAEAWKRGSMADSSRTLSALNAAVEESWRAGNCCGQCTAGGVCQSIHLQVFRYLHWGYYYAGVAVKQMGSFCDRTPQGLAEIGKVINSSLMVRLQAERMLEIVFSLDRDRNFRAFRKVREIMEKSGMIEVKQITQQLIALQGEAIELVDNIELAMVQADIVALATKLVRATVNRLAALQGIPLGFEVDRQYSPEELVGPLTEAAAMGVPFRGYAFGIVQGRFFCKVPGYEHLLKSKRSVQTWSVQIGDIEIIEEPGWIELPKEKQYKNRDGKIVTGRKSHGRAKVEVIATIVIDGQEYRQEYVKRTGEGQIDSRISLDMKTAGEDSLTTRARRRALKYLWSIATGHTPTPDGDDASVIDATYEESQPALAAPVAAIEAAQPAPAPSGNAERITKMLDAFAGLGVTVSMIRDRLKVDDLATIGEQELSLLGTVYKAMKDKNRTWAETE